MTHSEILKLAAVVLGAGVFVIGCSAAQEPTEQRWKGQFVTLTSSDGVELCGGMLAFVDRFVGYNYRYWTGGAPLPDVHLKLDLQVEQSGTLGFSGGAYPDKGRSSTS